MRQTWQRCDDCGNELDERDPSPRCPMCRGLLAVVHATTEQARSAAVLPGAGADQAASLRARLAADRSPSGVWRFGELVLPSAVGVAVSHPEGNTPLIERAVLRDWCGVDELQLKHEGHNPTGSFKDRGMTVGMTQAKRIGASAVACASTGNTSASLAAYAAQAGIAAFAIVPDGQVTIGKLSQTLAYGARTLLVDGDFDDCLRLMEQISSELGVYLLNSINPFRIEGQKTIVFEMLQQLDWNAPDWIVLPAGNLGNTAAFGKAIDEALALGLIARRPRLAAVQAEGAAPFAAAFARGFDQLRPVHADTIATAIKIGAPASFARAARAITATHGVVLAVSDPEILAAKAAVDRAGVGCEPASAAAVAGVRKLRAAGTIGANERVVAVLTGHILKDPGVLQQIHRDDSIAPELANRPIRIAPDIAAVRELLNSLGSTGR
jgi:threonine synthase